GAVAVPRASRSPRFGAGDEPVEYGQRIERARRALGVVLDRFDRQRLVAQPFDGAVVQVDLAQLEPGAGRYRVAHHRALVVLGGDLNEPQVNVTDRMVRAVVPKSQP